MTLAKGGDRGTYSSDIVFFFFRGAAGRLADAAAFQQLQADKQAAAQQAARDKEEIEKLRAELSSVKSVALCWCAQLSEHDTAAQAPLEAEKGQKAEIDEAEKVLQSMGTVSTV